jgi:hypothetical protein
MVKKNAGSLARRRSLYAPIEVSLLGANTVMFDANDIAHLVEQFGFVFRRPAGYRPLHDADSAVSNPELKPD